MFKRTVLLVGVAAGAIALSLALPSLVDARITDDTPIPPKTTSFELDAVPIGTIGKSVYKTVHDGKGYNGTSYQFILSTEFMGTDPKRLDWGDVCKIGFAFRDGFPIKFETQTKFGPITIPVLEVYAAFKYEIPCKDVGTTKFKMTVLDRT